MSFRTPIVGYEERGHSVAIFSAPPCVFVEVDAKELGPFYANMGAAREAATRHIDGIVKAEAEAKKEKKRA